jgi:hypothetical protein
VERLCRKGGEEGLGEDGLKRTRLTKGDMGQKGGEPGSASRLEGLVDLIGLVWFFVWFEVVRLVEEWLGSWSEVPGP